MEDLVFDAEGALEVAAAVFSVADAAVTCLILSFTLLLHCFLATRAPLGMTCIFPQDGPMRLFCNRLIADFDLLRLP